MSRDSELVETWAINNRILLYLLAEIDPEHLGDRTGGKGRSVGEQFAHLHNVRLMWLKSASPDLLAGLDKLEKDAAADRELLGRSLEASGLAIAALLERAFAGDGRIKGFKPHAAAFLGYLISHESHHRGQLVVSLKLAGHPVSQKVAYGLWEWGVR
jgi:uncharacterized damage-inducible protein DinB